MTEEDDNTPHQWWCGKLSSLIFVLVIDLSMLRPGTSILKYIETHVARSSVYTRDRLERGALCANWQGSRQTLILGYCVNPFIASIKLHVFPCIW